ncbi:MAG: hypothetical protein HY459_01335 [Parcubacteria group bacterium]|nr:hypothetical protein [Parcubacteria group bacterium]
MRSLLRKVLRRGIEVLRKKARRKDVQAISLARYVASEEYQQAQRIAAAKSEALFKYEHDQALLRRVLPVPTGRGVDYRAVDSEFSNVTITSEALEKATFISRRIVELSGRSLEVYLYTLDRTGREGEAVGRDVYVAKDQHVSEAACDVEGVIPSALDIRARGYRRIGWTHSHGHFAPFFSGKDRSNMRTVFDTTDLCKRVRVTLPGYGGAYEGIDYRVQYATAIVVNARGDAPFGAVALGVKCLDGREVYRVNEDVVVSVINEQNGIDLSPSVIDRELADRVRYQGRRLPRAGF